MTRDQYSIEQCHLIDRLYRDLLEFELEPGQRQVVPQTPPIAPPAVLGAALRHPIARHPARPLIHRLVMSPGWTHLTRDEKARLNAEIDSPFDLAALEEYRQEWQEISRGYRSDWTRAPSSPDEEPGGYVSVTSRVRLLGIWVSRGYLELELLPACPVEGGCKALFALVPAGRKPAPNGKRLTTLLDDKGRLKPKVSPTLAAALLWLAEQLHAENNKNSVLDALCGVGGAGGVGGDLFPCPKDT